VRLAEVAHKIRDERAAIYVRAPAMAEQIRTDMAAWRDPHSPGPLVINDQWHQLHAELGAYGSEAVFAGFDQVVKRAEEMRARLQHRWAAVYRQ
jgi:hypothetical protein